jgi:hypothetical protein
VLPAGFPGVLKAGDTLDGDTMDGDPMGRASPSDESPTSTNVVAASPMSFFTSQPPGAPFSAMTVIVRRAGVNERTMSAGSRVGGLHLSVGPGLARK